MVCKIKACKVWALGSSGTFQEYKDARKETENEWLKDLRQYQGIYEPDILARLNESRREIKSIRRPDPNKSHGSL